MTITAEELKKAFAPITSIEKNEPVELDLHKVATALITETNEFVSSDDPMANLDSICKRVDEIDTLLSKASSEEDGTVMVSSADEIAKDFAPEDTEKAKKKVNPFAPGGDLAGDKNDEEMKGKKKSGDKEKAKKSEESGEDTDSGTKTETEKADDEVTWEDDLSPKEMPLSRKARMTKSERPIPARRGGRAALTKYERARERALNGGEDRSTE